ncbi:MAG: tryptophan 7-halogenase [Verrucomicrobiales bacterium]|nr:tryptophan 7-halogenase [Verrucomicrobiales bacterium]
MRDPSRFDVVIAGGGLAGQSLARQLRMQVPGVTVALVDAQRRPLPEAAFKVGEATAELAAHYLAEHLKLRDHLEQDHLLKCGLRFFFGDGRGALSDRPEYGPRQFPPITSYQLDRGRLENHLRELNQAESVVLWEGYEIEDIEVGVGGAPHTTRIRDPQTGIQRRLESRWIVDCAGRRRFLQRKLGLGRPSPLRHSACWFRVAGNCDVDQWVASDQDGWHGRVPGGVRHRSTNHLLGRGYWVWLIPLSSGNTSVGIVVDERIHPVATLDAHAKAMAWLESHEPLLARQVSAHGLMDFHALKEFSYATCRFYSADRWACTGEAAMFIDPLYSPGSDFIALGNTLATQLIREDHEGRLTTERLERYNDLMLLWQDAFTEVFQDHLPNFGCARLTTAKVVWDNASYWVFVCQVFFQGVILMDDFLDRYRAHFAWFYQLNQRVQRLFRQWGQRTRDGAGFGYLGYADFEVAVRSHLELGQHRTPRRFLEWLEWHRDRFTAWAIVLFCIAVEDVAPAVMTHLAWDRIAIEDIDLGDLEGLAARCAGRPGVARHPLAQELRGLSRQMTKLFPEFRCLQSMGVPVEACGPR